MVEHMSSIYGIGVGIGVGAGMAVTTPEWVKHAVFYQIFPDRFSRSPRLHHRPGIQLQPWGNPPEKQGFQGGDLLGIVDKLDYLQELGITALYLNPVFTSASNHRYHTYDYLAIDPLLGGAAALRELLDAAHACGMHVVLDAVFNHASRGFWPFHHVLENGGDSPYVDWFYIQDWPLHPYPPDDQTSLNYEAWWGLAALPKLNVSNPGVRDYLLEVAQYWIDFGADGWRLDVPEEIDDALFWQDFRAVVKHANPDAYLVGEIWHDARTWLLGDRFDAVMNYVFSRTALGFFGAETLRIDYKPGGFPLVPLDEKEFAKVVQHMHSVYDWKVVQSQLNLIDSHDTARALWIVDGDLSALRLCVLFQMTMPGAPCIYYGDEIGMTGATDPYCRAAFPWQDERRWNLDLLAFYRRAVAMRHQYPVLRTGSVTTVYAAQGVYGCMRQAGTQGAVVLFNTGTQPVRVSLDNLDPKWNGSEFVGVWNHGRHVVQDGNLQDIMAPARDALVLVNC